MRRSLVAVAALLFVSCLDPTAPEEDLLVTASITPSILRVGEAAEVVVTILNRGNRTHSVSSVTCPAPYVVSRQDETVVGPGFRYCALVWIPPKELPPGERLVLTDYWYGDGLGALSPGTYLLRGSVHATGADDRVTGAPVSVTITE